MARTRSNLIAVGTLVASLVLGLGVAATAATAVTAQDPSATKSATKKEKKVSYARLPAHYGKLVDQQQREAIYEIQNDFGPKIKALKDQLAALIHERNEKIAAVLTAEQCEQLEQLKAEAKAKRKKSHEAKQASAAEVESEKQ